VTTELPRFFLLQRKTENLITNSPIANSTGYTNTFTNIGLMEGDGFEFDLGLHVVRNANRGFNWNIILLQVK
jgi:hypothetical protein